MYKVVCTVQKERAYENVIKQTCIPIPNELPLSFLAKSIANQPLNSFSLSPDTASKSFSAEHSREPLLTEQSRHTRWNLFAFPTIPNH